MKPVCYTDDHNIVVQAKLKCKTLSNATWSEEILREIRNFIKSHYIMEQKYKCCYCRKEMLSAHGRVWDVEHIISRSTKPLFMFEPRNLAVSCVECNQYKSNVHVMARNFRVFPHKSNQYLIIHPHFDKYEDHIEIEGENTYVPLSKKGKFTIYHCDLFRFREREARIRRPIKDRRFEKEIGELRYARSISDAEPIIASIRAIIQRVEDEDSAVQQ